MLRLHYRKNQRARIFDQLGTRVKNAPTGQIFLEYVIVIGVVTLIIIAMSAMIKRGTQGMIKVVADQVGNQINAEQQFDEDSFLESSYTSTRMSTGKTKTELIGVTTYAFDDAISVKSNTQIRMGFTEED